MRKKIERKPTVRTQAIKEEVPRWNHERQSTTIENTVAHKVETML